MPKECCKETWQKIPDDEPVFIVRGKDLLSSDVVKAWILRAEAVGVPKDKVTRAQEHWRDIVDFQSAHPERCKMPD